MTDLTPTLYLPVEESHRELESKLLIALEVLPAGIAVVVGRSPMIISNFGAMPPGVVLLKGMNAISAYLMKQLPSHGHVGMATDEEALGLAHPSVLVRTIDSSIGKECHILFAQGPNHAKAIAERVAGAEGRIRIVGNARLDLLRAPFSDAFRDDANRLQAGHGDYVMVDTNFGAINSQWGGTETFKAILYRVGWLDAANPDDDAYYQRRLRTEEANITLIRRVLEALSARFPKIKFVIRPHPAERDEPWRKAYAKQDNILVSREGSHIPWLLGSRLMIHTGCTTGLEAEVLGVPCLTLLPENHTDLISADLLSNHANRRAVGAADAAALTAEILNGPRNRHDADRQGRFKALEEHVTALEGAFAYQRVAEVIKEFLGESRKAHPDFRWDLLPGRPFVATREQYEARIGSGRGTDYVWGKSDMSAASLTNRLDALARAAGSGFQPLATEIGEGLFRLEAGSR